MPLRPSRADYGVDAPYVLYALMAFGFLSAGLGMVGFLGFSFWTGVPILLAGIYWFWSSKIGKQRVAKSMLQKVDWRGDEVVLDIGCGRGTLLVPAAKMLKTGKAIGVDRWSKTDLSGNKPEETLRNAEIEGVADRVHVETGDARKLRFPDSYFDIVLSSLMLHNIESKVERKKALQEMLRVLRPGGKILIFDMSHIGEYIVELRAGSISDIYVSPPVFLFFLPCRFLAGVKLRE